MKFSFVFRPEIPFWGKFGPKNQNWKFKLKFLTLTYYGMLLSTMMFTFFISVGWWVGWSVDQSVSWCVGQLVGQSLVGLSVGWLVGWFVNQLVR